jgi:RNA polymerase sigma-70 factor (sigma-E family)
MSDLQPDYERMYAGAYWRLVGQLSIITGNPQEAQDVVQEALFRAWSHWTKVSRYADPEGWVRRVAINVATSRWRKARPLGQMSSAVGGDVSSGPEQRDEVLDLLVLLRRMPQREREALALFYVVDLSVREVADVMGTRIGTAKSLLSRGRQHLRQLLSDGEREGSTHVR